MTPLTSTQIRAARQSFWESHDHANVGSASLIPDSHDKTVLFNTAGMQPLVPYLMGKTHPNGTRLYNIQRCLRTGDIEDVGDPHHLTCFEMMGNRSLGDYFKRASLQRSVVFLTQHLGIPMDKLGITVYSGEGIDGIGYDTEAAQIAADLGFAEHQIVGLEAAENFWGPAGEVGPCGPCAEFYVDRGDDRGPDDRALGVNDRYVEVRNNVFMAYYKDADGTYTQLDTKNVDTGMGLERTCMILQDKATVYETDLFVPILDVIAKQTNATYPGFGVSDIDFDDAQATTAKRMRIIADHIRATLFLLADGVSPSNEGRGYVIRRLIRRAYYNYLLLHDLTLDAADPTPLIRGIYDAIIPLYGQHHSALSDMTIVDITITEMQKFMRTIHSGLSLMDDLIKKNTTTLPGDQLFTLYDTYGFPLELAREIAAEQGRTIDEAGFAQTQADAQERSRQGSGSTFSRGIDWASYIEGLPSTQFVGYDQLSVDGIQLLKERQIDGTTYMVFDTTPLYATGGGQVADTGQYIADDGTTYTIVDVIQYAGVWIHQIG